MFEDVADEQGILGEALHGCRQEVLQFETPA